MNTCVPKTITNLEPFYFCRTAMFQKNLSNKHCFHIQITMLPGVSKLKNKTKQNRSCTHNNCKICISQCASNYCSGYIRYLGLIFIFQYCYSGKTIRCCWCTFNVVIIRKAENYWACLARTRCSLFWWPTSACVWFMPFSYTKWLYINQTVSLANR